MLAIPVALAACTIVVPTLNIVCCLSLTGTDFLQPCVNGMMVHHEFALPL